MKSTERRRGSLAFQLIRTYLALTFAVLVAFFLIQWLVNYEYSVFLPPSDIPGFIRTLEMKADDAIDQTALKRYLGRSSDATIYDENGSWLGGAKRDDLPQSKEELDLLSFYGSETSRSTVDYLDDEGKVRQMILLERYAEDRESGYILLDEDGTVIDKSLPLGGARFSERELSFLIGRGENAYDLYRQDYVRADGTKRSVVLSLYRFDDGSYGRALGFFQYAGIAMISLYVLLVVISILRLNKKTKKLLQPLSLAIDSLMTGTKSAPIAYDGPDEFVDIYGRFNALSEQLSASEHERRKLDAEKTRMLTDISHDLRTPVTVISGYAQALKDDVVPPERVRQYLATIEQKSEQLARLIDNFFAYSLIDDPNLLFEPKRSDLVDVTQAYFADKYQEIDLAGFGLEVTVPDEPIFVMVDVGQMQRVFDNLLGNAVSHNPPGTTISVMLSSNESTAELIIGNDGNAIPSHLAESIFQPFVVSDDSRGKIGHSGLGLAITAKIVQRHGGKVELLMPPPDGCATAFRLCFPALSEI